MPDLEEMEVPTMAIIVKGRKATRRTKRREMDLEILQINRTQMMTIMMRKMVMSTFQI